MPIWVWVSHVIFKTRKTCLFRYAKSCHFQNKNIIQPWLLTLALISKLENNAKQLVWVWLCGCGCGCNCVGVGVLVWVCVISMIQTSVLLQYISVSSKVKSNLSHDRRILVSCLTCCALSSLIANSFHLWRA